MKPRPRPPEMQPIPPYMILLPLGMLLIVVILMIYLRKTFAPPQQPAEPPAVTFVTNFPIKQQKSTPEQEPEPIYQDIQEEFLARFKAAEDKQPIDPRSDEFCYFLKQSLATPPAAYEYIPLEEILRDPDKYRAKPVKFRGRLFFFIPEAYRPPERWGLPVDTLYFGIMEEEKSRRVITYYTAELPSFPLPEARAKPVGGRKVISKYIQIYGRFLRLYTFETEAKDIKQRTSAFLIVDHQEEIPPPGSGPRHELTFLAIIVGSAFVLIICVFVIGVIVSARKDENIRMMVYKLRKKGVKKE